jgi:hypothetical protein
MTALLRLCLLSCVAGLLGCPPAAPCTWTVVNDTGEALQELYSTRTGSAAWGPDILAGTPLGYGEPIAFDVDGGRRYDLLGLGESGDRFIAYRAVECEDGEVLQTSLGIADREL